MADDTIIHRTLWDVTKLARPGYDQPDPLFGPQHKPRRPLQGSLSGYQMIGKFIDAQMVSARLTRLAPRGAWVVVTESEEFAKALETTAKLRAKVMRREFPAFHEGAPVSVHPKETSRFALIIRS